MKIIYEQDSEIVAVLAVNSTILDQIPIQEAGEIFVPKGKRFRVVDDSELPDEDFVDAWRVDFTVNDGVGMRG